MAGRPKSIDQALEESRARLDRLTPQQASGAVREGDTRYAALRDRDGLILGALVVERKAGMAVRPALRRPAARGGAP